MLNLTLCVRRIHNMKKRIYSRNNFVNKLLYPNQAACGENHLPVKMKLDSSNKNPVVC